MPWWSRLVSASATGRRGYILHSRAAAISTLPYLGNRTKSKKRKKKESPRTRSVQQEAALREPHFESILERDSEFRFLTRTKDFLARQPGHVLLLDDAGKLHSELGFPRGRKFTRSAARHPLLLSLYRHTDGKCWVGLSDLMEELLEEERAIAEAAMPRRIEAVRKLLMMSRDKRIPLSKIHHCRHVFGIFEDFRDRVADYPEYFRVTIDPADGKRRILELVEWDPSLAVSKLEKDFVLEEDRVRRTFKFPVPHGKSLGLEEEEEKRMDSVSTLPLVSPYSDGSGLKLWSVEAEKWRVGLIHEFLSLTLEKRASIHHIVEFKEEFCLTKHTYQMLRKQHRAFYLAGTEMNWAVFLREGYKEDGTLIEKDPQVLFNKKLRRYACMTEEDFRKERELQGPLDGAVVGVGD